MTETTSASNSPAPACHGAGRLDGRRGPRHFLAGRSDLRRRRLINHGGGHQKGVREQDPPVRRLSDTTPGGDTKAYRRWSPRRDRIYPRAFFHRGSTCDRPGKARRALLAPSEGADTGWQPCVRNLRQALGDDGRPHRSGEPRRGRVRPPELPSGLRSVQLRGRGPDLERDSPSPTGQSALHVGRHVAAVHRRVRRPASAEGVRTCDHAAPLKPPAQDHLGLSGS